ncbi:hypothetical protein [Thermotalea metallivorans]|uniref:DnaA N-terminal domain-containing protein n=1 Tax=Thermotalea metallivorans TaxID=520762 RepID=A0A140LA01_9FIRM|nr:hypothetical protein [Thermotalea metallivorans]KXG77376.1 hypothetical protein AN619_05020 [Thermotalea metallivorans]
MSKLLLDEQPLVLLPQLAIVIGLNEAIILQQINYWVKLKEKARAKDAYKDGKYWVYNTYEEWQKQFPFWSTKTIKRTIRNLEEIGILISTDIYNEKKYDKTKWYRIDYERLAFLEKGSDESDEKVISQNIEKSHEDKLSHGTNLENAHEDKLSPGEGQNVPMHRDKMSPPIPEINSEITTDIIQSFSHDRMNDRMNDNQEKELQEILKRCEFAHLKSYYPHESLIDSVEQAVIDMYYATELKVQDTIIPRSVCRESLKKLDHFVIEYVLTKYKSAAESEKIKSPKNYLKSCIYNAISECSLAVYADVSYDLNNAAKSVKCNNEIRGPVNKTIKSDESIVDEKEDKLSHSILERYSNTIYYEPLANLNSILARPSFNTFIEGIQSIYKQKNILFLAVKDNFIKDMLLDRYGVLLKEEFKVDQLVIEVEGYAVQEELQKDFLDQEYVQLKIIS